MSRQKWRIILYLSAFILGAALARCYGDTVTEDSLGNVFVTKGDGSQVRCFVIGSGPTKTVVCNPN